MLNSRLVLSGNLSGSYTALSLPGPISLTGAAYAPGGSNGFDATQLKSYSLQCFVTGSNVNGTLAVQQSNNMAGWVSVSGSTQAVAGTNLNQDYFFSVPVNNAGYARMLWSGSAGVGSFITIAMAGTV